ncbi:phage major capsid protein [Mycobacterium sp. 852014-50255_SCH5639931]|uniref:phage major capsid protein n=1 Tax=Mycobacterium sp. 852014-50255_SCH5639931 TaxID=1834112 RepID=UPI0009EF2FF5|nr:phage major capsid protein [Mycobacterium sp. 852014-50255_SCH5639931]
MKSVDAAISPGDDPGTFDLLLSDDSLDRDGDRLWAYQWIDPLPKTISVSVNHSRDVSDVVGSGSPYIEADGSLRVHGKFASTPLAQCIRKLVCEGHIRSVSVEYLRGKNGNELVGGSFVTLPANRNARVLAAKALGEATMNDSHHLNRYELDLRALEQEFGTKVFAGELTEEQVREYEKRHEDLRVKAASYRVACKFNPPGSAPIARRSPELRDKHRAPNVILDDAQCKALYDKAAMGEAAQLRCKEVGFNDTVEAQIPPELAPWITKWVHEKRIIDRLPSVACTAPSYEIRRHVSTSGAAAIVGEGQPKPEVKLNLDNIVLPMLKLAAHSAESWETISDSDVFTQYLQQELPLRIVDVENQQVLYGLGTDSNELLGLANTPYILTHNCAGSTGTEYLDDVEESIEEMRSAQALAEPDLFIVSPTSWSALRRIKDDLHRYILSADPSSAEAQTLWGVNVLVTTQCRPGDGFLLDTARFGKVIIREGITIRQGTAEDDFIRNLLRWVFEERLNIGVERPSAVLMLSNLPVTVSPGS